MPSSTHNFHRGVDAEIMLRQVFVDDAADLGIVVDHQDMQWRRRVHSATLPRRRMIASPPYGGVTQSVTYETAATVGNTLR